MAFDPTRGYHDNPLSLQTYGDTRAEINLISPIPILLVKKTLPWVKVGLMQVVLS